MDCPRCYLPGSPSALQATNGRYQFLRFQTSFDVLVGKCQADGMTIDEIMQQFDVAREQVTAVLDFAARSLQSPTRR